MGPTAAGKTSLAIALCEKLNAQIISVDSALVYRGMDIGSAKPTAEELRCAPHRLIDIRDPAEPYSAADFCRDAKREMEAVLALGKTPLLVGGTMLYFKALLEGLSDLPEADPLVRAKIKARADKDGWLAIHAELAKVDPASASQIHPNHSQRLSRALEIYLLTGKPLSSLHQHQEGGLLTAYDWRQIIVAPSDRSIIHRRIEQRFDKMIDAGLLAEVQGLIARGDLHKDLPAIRAVGYRQAWEHLSGEYDFNEMRDRSLAATRQLAKRQLTWLRAWPGAYWIDTLDAGGENRENDELVADILKYCSE